MSFSVTVDEATCQGYACCMMTAPTIFDLDDAGRAVVTRAGLDDSERELAERAVRGCPARAIAIAQG